jgi:hypothetical protein
VRVWRAGAAIAASLAVFALGCAGQRAPAEPRPAPPPLAVAPLAAPAPTAKASPPVAEPPPPPPKQQNEVVIHTADLHGKVKGRAGKHITIEPLVATSQTVPVKGNKGAIYRESTQDEWLLLAEVVIADTMVPGKPIAVDIVDEKKDVLLGGKKVNHFVPGTMVRLRWEWQ